MKSFRYLLLIPFLTGFTQAQNLKQAIRFMENEQFTEAEKMFRQLRLTESTSGIHCFYLGEVFFRQDMYDSAQTHYQKGTQVQPSFAYNFAGLGKIQWQNGKSEDAKSLFENAIKLSGGKDAGLYCRIAEAYLVSDKKDPDVALAMLQTAQKLDPKNPEVYNLLGDAFQEKQDGNKAIENYKLAEKLDPNSVTAILRQGKLYGRSKNYPLAFELYTKAAKIDSMFAPAYREQAEVYYLAKKFEMAKAKYKRFLELSGNNMDARKRYASFIFLSKDYQEAINQITQIQKEDTASNILNRLLAYSHCEKGDNPAALSAMNRFFSRAGNEKTKIIASDYEYQGRIFYKNGKDSLALISYKTALSMDSSKQEIYGEMANASYKQKKFEDAILYAEKKIASGKSVNANDHYTLGKSYFSLGNYVKADTCFGSVISLSPKLPQGYLWRAKANTQIDKDSKAGLAKIWYEKYIPLVTDVEKNKRDLLEANLYLGAYYFQTDKVKAKEYWLKVAELDPANEKAKKALETLK